MFTMDAKNVPIADMPLAAIDEFVRCVKIAKQCFSDWVAPFRRAGMELKRPRQHVDVP